MNLESWLDNAWVEEHTTSKQEITNLLIIVDRDLKDVKQDISSDSKFGLAYNCCSHTLYYPIIC